MIVRSRTLLSALALALSLANPGCRSNSGPLRLGLALSLRDPGILPMRRGAELAVREINAAGGVGGRPLQLVAEDDSGDPDSAVAVAARLYESDVLAVIGGAYSGVTLAAAPVYNGGRRPMVQLSPSASTPVLTTAGEFTFRICPSDLAYGAALARYASNHDLSRAAVLYVNDEYGRGVRRTFSAEFSSLGGELVEADPFLAGSPDVSVYLGRIARQKRANVLILAANQEEGLAVLAQVAAARLGIPVIAADGMTGAERVNPRLMEGVYVAAAYIAQDARTANKVFVRAYQRAYPDAGLPDQGAASSYDAVRLLAGILGDGGTDRRHLRAGLAEVGTARPAFEGVVGQVVFDANGDVPGLAVQVGVVRQGELVPAE